MNTLSSPEVAIPDLWITILKSGAMLCIVLGILIVVLFMLKRFFHGQGRYSKRGLIKILASHHITPKESILLVDVLGERILIGATSQNINCLAKIDGHEESDASLVVPTAEGVYVIAGDVFWWSDDEEQKTDIDSRHYWK